MFFHQLTMKKKYYISHELIYQQMKEKYISNWNERSGLLPIESSTKRFLNDVLDQKWMRKAGRAIELGCGTAPLLRWLYRKNWCGVGVDISTTAIEMAQTLSDGLDIEYMVEDVTKLPFADNTFDFALDGQCMHCLTTLEDRESFISEALRIIKPGGCLVLLTMAKPILPIQFKKQHGRMKSGIVYHPIPNANTYQNAKKIDGQYCIPVRYFEHWESILDSLVSKGFKPMLIRINLCSSSDPLSYLCVAAVKC